MKRTFGFLLIGVITIAAARAGDLEVEGYMTNSPKEEAATIFTANNPTLFAMVKAKGTKNGDKIRGVWIADDVGDAAPKGFKIDEKALTAEGDLFTGEFSLSKPDGWPAGQYHIEIFVNDTMATKLKFTVKPGKVKEPESQDDQDESSEE